MLRPERQAFQALHPPPGGFPQQRHAGKSPPAQHPQGGAEQQQDHRHRRHLLDHFHSSPPGRQEIRRLAPQKSSRKSVMRTPSAFSITTISPEPQSTPPM